jgi:hypothetical protein
VQFVFADDGTGYLPGFAPGALDPCGFLVPPWNPHVSGWVDRRTPSVAVPDTYAGALYKALPKVALAIAQRLVQAIDNDLPPGGTIENIARLIDENLFNIPFAEFASGDVEQNIMRLVDKPIIVDDVDAPAQTFPINLAFGLIGKGEIPLPMRTVQGQTTLAAPILIRLMSRVDLIEPNPFFTCWNDPASMPYVLNYSNAHGFTVTPLVRDFVFDSVRSLLWQGAGSAHPTAFVLDAIPENIRELYRQVGRDLDDASSRVRLSNTIKGILFVVAVLSIGFAAQAISAQGLTVQTGTKMLLAVDRIPGVDFGVGSDILRVVNRATSFGSSALIDAGADVAARQGGEMWDDYTGEFIGGSTGGWDFGGFGGIDFGGSFDSAISNLTQSSTSIFGDFNLQSFIGDLAKTYVQYDLGRRLAEQQGQRPPAARPTPGQTYVLPDGSTARTNADGSTTVTSRTGQVRTVTPTGQIVAGGSSANWIPGVPNIALIAGAAGIGALMLMRRGRR